MKVHRGELIGAFFTVIVVLVSEAGLAMQPGTSNELLRRHIQAMGGEDAIAAVRTAHIAWNVKIAGIEGTVDEYYAVPANHYIKVITPVITQTEGENGRVKWTADQNDRVSAQDIPEDEKPSTSREVLPCFQYMFPENPHRVTDAGKETVAEKEYRVLEIKKASGPPKKLYLDPDTLLVAIEKGSEKGIPVTTTYSDYRPVNGVMFAFKYVQQAEIPGMPPTEMTIASITLNEDLPPGLFDPPENGAEDFSFPEGAAAVEIPLDIDGEHIFVAVSVNGKGPFRFLLDSGAGATVVGRKLAAQLGLETKDGLRAVGVGGVKDLGATRLDSFAIGGFTIKNFRALTGAMDFLADSFQEPVDGIVGFDLFTRTVVKLDILNEKLELIPPDSFSAPEGGTVVNGELKSNLMHIPGKLKCGLEGLFRVDTGAGGGVHFHAPFVKKHRLTEKYDPKFTVTAAGIGGDENTILTRIGGITIGGITVNEPLATLTLNEKSGALSMTDSAGTIGNAVWKKFTVWFDYPRHRLILEPNETLGQRMTFNRAGLLIFRKNGAITVHTVFPGSPAEDAGIESGDIIVKVNKLDAEDVSLKLLRKMFRGPEKTPLVLKLLRNGKTLRKKIVLREIL